MIRAVLVLALSLLALAQGQPSEFRGGSLLPFHLADTDGSCLTADGQMGACDERSLWTYLKRGSKKEGHSLVSFLEPMAEQSCLARSDCRKPKSALGPQKCGACGAKHWELVRDRTSGNYLVMANDRKQCLVREPRSEDVKKHLLALQKKKKRLEDSFDAKRPSLANGVVMQPCDKGFTLLQLVERPFHDVGFQLQTADGACFTGADFRRCDAKSASLIWGGGVRFDRKGEAQKFFYKWHDGKRCLLRDGASAALGDCDKGGAQGWGLRGGRLTVNKGKDCLARDLANKARVVSCTLGHEHLSLELAQQSSSRAGAGAGASSAAASAAAAAAAAQQLQQQQQQYQQQQRQQYQQQQQIPARYR